MTTTEMTMEQYTKFIFHGTNLCRSVETFSGEFLEAESEKDARRLLHIQAFLFAWLLVRQHKICWLNDTRALWFYPTVQQLLPSGLGKKLTEKAVKEVVGDMTGAMQRRGSMVNTEGFVKEFKATYEMFCELVTAVLPVLQEFGKLGENYRTEFKPTKQKGYHGLFPTQDWLFESKPFMATMNVDAKGIGLITLCGEEIAVQCNRSYTKRELTVCVRATTELDRVSCIDQVYSIEEGAVVTVPDLFKQQGWVYLEFWLPSDNFWQVVGPPNFSEDITCREYSGQATAAYGGGEDEDERYSFSTEDPIDSHWDEDI